MSKKILLITLLFATITFGQYVAPNEDTVVVVGGLGTQADKNSLNGGGATKAAWDAGSPSDFIGTNGGTITADTAVTYSNGTKTFSKTGIGTGVTVGTLAYVSGTNITAGIYEITARTNDTIVCANIVAAGDNTDSVVNVGGALDTLQNALDNDVTDAASFSRYIYNNIASVEVTAPVDVDTNAGTNSTRIQIIGYNSTLAAESEVIITTTSDILSLLQFNNASRYYIIRGIDFNGGGKDAVRAEFCVGDTDAVSHDIVFEECKFRGAESHGVEMDSDRWQFYKCEASLNGGSGILSVANDGVNNRYFGCSFHDNDSHGLQQDGLESTVVGCLSYDNGKGGTGNGFTFPASGDQSLICGNTAYGNAGDGFNLLLNTDYCSIFNNTSVGNGGYGYQLNGGTIRPLSFFGYNHASVNTSGHYSEGADNTFANFRGGSNKADTTAAADIFTSVTDGSEDFTPKSGTDLIDNALDAGVN